MTVFAKRGIPRSRAAVFGASLATVSLTALALTACSATTTTPAPEETTAAAVCGPDAVADAVELTPATLDPIVERATTLTIGTVLPQTGTLSFLGPPEEAGVALALADINASPGGVLGGNVSSINADSGDGTLDIASAAAGTLLSQGVSAIVGAASSGVTRFFIDQVTDASVVQISPANTAPDLSTWDDNGFFWRTAPSDVLQGRVLGNLITGDGAETVGVIYLNDPYGIGLEENLGLAVDAAGGEIVASEIFNAGEGAFASQVDAVLAEDPDAIAVIAFDETISIVKELIGTKGYPSDKVYFVDGNLADYSEDLDAGLLNCAKGTLPGVLATDDFKERLLAIDPDLKEYSYAAESYDATVLLALAAIAAGDASGPGIQSQLQAVSEGGTKVTTFAEGAELLAAGEDIDYDGISGPITFDENGDPTEAYVGIYQFGSENTYAPLDVEYGSLQ